MSGIGETNTKIKTALTNYYASQNVSDFLIKSSSQTGFTTDQINYITEKFGEENVMKGFSMEQKIDEQTYRIFSLDLKDMKISKFELLEGTLPTSNTEILVERKTDFIIEHKVGDKITINGSELTVTGIILNPMLLQNNKEPSYLDEDSPLENAIYFDKSLGNPPFVPSFFSLPTNDLYITIENRSLFDAFSKGYKSEIEAIKTSIELENATILSLYENYGFYSLVTYSEKVGNLATIFVVFFMIVTALVVFSTMTRLLDEERMQIACLKTLGYSDIRIISKYLIFIFTATLIGGLLAWGVGVGLTDIIYYAFNIQYAMPPTPAKMFYSYYLATLSIIMVSTLLVTWLTGLNMTKNRPSVLLLPKAPIPGKKVLIERIPFIWNNLSFKYKSSLRNVFLFKSRFFMTVISIIGSTVLVLAGFGLLDNTIKSGKAISLVMIAVAIIVFAGLLCLLVIYNIANINISERGREISTLMVLGYHDNEVTTYIYREIYIMSAIGALLGVPLGAGFIVFVFGYIDFGTIADVNWWSWIVAPVVTMLFTFLSTLLLRHKIVKTDMNASLKSIE